MTMIKDKPCRKCGSRNVYLEYDIGRWFEHCLICGYTTPLEEVEPSSDKDATWPNDISIEA